MNYKSWVLKALFVASCVALSGCGGSDEVESDNSNQLDTIKPTLSFTAPQTEYWSADALTLGVSASDNAGTPTISITCSAGQLQGNHLTLPSTSTLMTVACTATATDLAGNYTTASLSLLVNPVVLTLESSEEYNPGQFVVLNYNGPSFEQSDIGMSIGTQSIEIYKVETSSIQLYASLPYLVGGEHEILTQIGNREFTLPISVKSSPEIVDAATFVEERLSSFITQWEQNNSNFAPELLAAAKSNFSLMLTQPEAKLTELAYMIRAYETQVSEFNAWLENESLYGGQKVWSNSEAKNDATPFFAQQMIPSYDPIKCDLTLLSLNQIKPLVVTVIGIVMIANSGGPAGALLGGTVTLGGLSWLFSTREDLLTNCVVRLISAIIESAKLSNSVFAQASGTLLVFEHDVEQVFKMNSELDFVNPQISPSFRGLFNALEPYRNSEVPFVALIVQSLFQVVNIDPRQTVTEDPKTLTLQINEDGNIEASIIPLNETSFALTVSYKDETKAPVDGEVDFSFTLKNDDENINVTTEGRLFLDAIPKLEFIWQGDRLGIDTNEQLARWQIKPGMQESKESLFITNTGFRPIMLNKALSGQTAITLDGPSEQLLNKDDQVVFEVSYLFQNANEYHADLLFGQQDRAEFDNSLRLIAELNYAYSYRVELRDGPTSEICSVAPYTLNVVLNKHDDGTYTADLGGYVATFSLNGSGLGTSGNASFNEDGGKTTESYSYQISHTGQVSGSASWVWVRDDNQLTCSNTTTVTGQIE